MCARIWMQQYAITSLVDIFFLSQLSRSGPVIADKYIALLDPRYLRNGTVIPPSGLSISINVRELVANRKSE